MRNNQHTLSFFPATHPSKQQQQRRPQEITVEQQQEGWATFDDDETREPTVCFNAGRNLTNTVNHHHWATFDKDWADFCLDNTSSSNNSSSNNTTTTTTNNDSNKRESIMVHTGATFEQELQSVVLSKSRSLDPETNATETTTAMEEKKEEEEEEEAPPLPVKAVSQSSAPSLKRPPVLVAETRQVDDSMLLQQKQKQTAPQQKHHLTSSDTIITNMVQTQTQALPKKDTHQPNLPSPPTTSPNPPRLLVLTSSLGRVHNQDRALLILQSAGIPYTTVDGVSQPTLRNALFQLSGCRRGIYPQFFLVHDDNNNDDKYSFVGDFDTIQAIHDASCMDDTELLQAHPSILTWDRLFGGKKSHTLVNSSINTK